MFAVAPDSVFLVTVMVTGIPKFLILDTFLPKRQLKILVFARVPSSVHSVG